jgi:hypothetical protein
MIKSKRAFELIGEHGVELIISVLAIVVLIFLGTSVANIFLQRQDQTEQAKSSLESIMSSIKSLEKEGDSKEIIVLNPKDWIISYQSDTRVGKRPISCQTHSCLCICRFSSDKDELFNNCNDEEKGICQIYDGESGGNFVFVEDNLIIDPPFKLKLSLDNNQVKIIKQI